MRGHPCLCAINQVMKKSILLFSFLLSLQIAFAQTIQKVAPGIWKITYGTPENHLPTEFKEAPLTQQLTQLPGDNTPPFDLEKIHFETRLRTSINS